MTDKEIRQYIAEKVPKMVKAQLAEATAAKAAAETKMVELREAATRKQFQAAVNTFKRLGLSETGAIAAAKGRG